LAGKLSVIAHHEGGLAFRAKSESGHEVVMDASAAAGGEDRGIRPMEMLLAGLAGCTGIDIISILKKMRQDVTDYEVRVSGERAEEHPKVFTHIVVEHVVTGHNLVAANVARAVELSATRYCSVSATLEGVAKVEHKYTLIEQAQDEQVVNPA
jgi:putative redox protein